MLAHDSRWPSVATACSEPLRDDEQHAVQVVTDVLLRHREFGRLQKSAELALRQRQRLHLILADADARVIGGRQRLQVEARPAGAKRHAVGGAVDRQLRVVGKRAQKILQLSRGDGGCLRLLAGKIRMRGDLHLEIGGGDVEPAVGLFEQHIRENREGMSAFDDAGHRLQWFQQRVSWNLF